MINYILAAANGHAVSYRSENRRMWVAQVVSGYMYILNMHSVWHSSLVLVERIILLATAATWLSTVMLLVEQIAKSVRPIADRQTPILTDVKSVMAVSGRRRGCTQGTDIAMMEWVIVRWLYRQ